MIFLKAQNRAAALTFLLCTSLLSGHARAMSLDWSGTYRAEAIDVDRTSLGDPRLRKSYLLNHLTLSPRVIASDGVYINSRFEVLPNREPRYANSQLGQFFGSGVKNPPASTNETDSNTMSQNAGGSQIYVNQLYLNVNNDYGSLILGRAPIQFGLGIRHNAGLGLFDHWYDTRDIIGYKVVVGNLSLTPMFGRAYSGTIGQGTQVNDQMIDIEYDNRETGSLLGIFYETRKGSSGANDVPSSKINPEGGGGTIQTDYSIQNVNVVLGRDWSTFDFKIEGGFTSGDSGVYTASQEQIRVNSFGVATELNFRNPESNWAWTVKAGIASGDNPNTKDYEGYVFDRNYDTGMLLFNHRLGKFDILRTYLSREPGHATDDEVDEEAISNTVYFAPSVTYKAGSKFDVKNTLVYAVLNTNPILGVDIDKNLGFEWDIDLVYKPQEKIQWINSVGLLFPGAAFKGGDPNTSNGFTYGFSSKAAISF